MKVLALVTDAFGGYGGIARYNQELVRALAALDAVKRVVILPRVKARIPGRAPEKAAQLPAAPGRTLYSVQALKTAAFGGPFNMVFCGHLFMAPLAALIAFLLRAPLWITVHGIEAWKRPGPLTRWAVSRASLITAVSRHTRWRVLEWANIPPERIRVLPNTVDAAFTPGAPPADLERQYRRPGRKILLTVCRLSRNDRYKGIGRVFDALPKLLAGTPDLLYLIVGEGDDREDLRRLAESRGIGERVRFVGNVTDDDLVGYYRLADAFVMPSTKEGFGIVFLEAAAAGASVIGGNSDGSVDALAEGEIGAMIDPKDVGTIVAALEAALASPRPAAMRVSRFRPASFREHLSRLMETFVPAGSSS